MITPSNDGQLEAKVLLFGENICLLIVSYKHQNYYVGVKTTLPLLGVQLSTHYYALRYSLMEATLPQGITLMENTLPQGTAQWSLPCPSTQLNGRYLDPVYSSMATTLT